MPTMRPHRMLAHLAIASLTLLPFGGCSDSTATQNAPAADAEPVSVSVTSTMLLPVDRVVEAPGTLFGDEEYTLAAKVPGRALAVLHDVGDRVEPGATLVQIDPTDYELEVRQRELAVEETLAQLGLSELPDDDFDLTSVPTVQRALRQAANAEAKLRRAEKLFNQEQPLISEQEFADLQTAFAVATTDCDVALLNAGAWLAEARTRQSELAFARQQLKDTTITAPRIEGRHAGFAVTARMISVGEYISAATPVFRIVADNPIKFRAAIPERFSSRVKVGQAARVRVAAYPEEPFLGEVSRINPQIDPLSRTFEIEVLINNDDARLRPGAFAQGQIVTHTEPDVTFVPQSAVVSFAGVTKIFTIDEGKAVEKIVETGVVRGQHVEITRGLTGVHQVVVENAAKLAAGVPVTVSEVPTTAANSVVEGDTTPLMNADPH